MEQKTIELSRVSKDELLDLIKEGIIPMASSATSAVPISYECEHCKDTGRVSVIEEHYGMECSMSVRCKYCYERREYKRLLASSGMGEAFIDKTFDNFKSWNKEAALARATAMRYAIEFEEVEHTAQNSLALLGTVGAGKTMLGCCVLNDLLGRNIGVRYVPYEEMVRNLKQSAMDEEEYNRHLGNYVCSRVLFIDDLFKGSCTAADLKHVYNVINGRYLAKRPMIITSELTIEQLLDIDYAIGSRIAERCAKYAFTFMDGAEGNYRLRGLL